MGSVRAPVALDSAGEVTLVGGIVIAIVLVCAAVGLNAWLRVRRIDRAATAQAAEPADPTAPTAPAAPGPPEPAGDLPEDPDYQGPGDWDGGPADPPEYREDQ